MVWRDVKEGRNVIIVLSKNKRYNSLKRTKNSCLKVCINLDYEHNLKKMSLF